jgi:hypothetical protein
MRLSPISSRPDQEISKETIRNRPADKKREVVTWRPGRSARAMAMTWSRSISNVLPYGIQKKMVGLVGSFTTGPFFSQDAVHVLASLLRVNDGWAKATQQMLNDSLGMAYQVTSECIEEFSKEKDSKVFYQYIDNLLSKVEHVEIPIWPFDWLETTKLSNTQMQIILMALSKNITQWKNLKLSILGKNDTSLILEVLEKINEISESSRPDLKIRIDLGPNYIDYPSYPAFASIIEALMNMLKNPHCKLYSINLNSNNIDDTGAQTIANGLAINRSLKHLTLCNNHISDAGAQAIANALAVNGTLEYIFLRHNDIEDPVSALAHAFKTNRTLKGIDVAPDQLFRLRGRYQDGLIQRDLL